MWCDISYINSQQHCDLISKTFIDIKNWLKYIQSVGNCMRANNLTL